MSVVKLTTNAGHLVKRFDRAVRDLKKVNTNTPYEVLKVGARMAKKIAPQKSGRLKDGIKVFKQRNRAVLQSIAISKDKYKFAYNLWVNENFKEVRLFGGRKRTYRSTNKTGMPGYFDLTMEFLHKFFPETYSIRVGRVLRMR